MLSPLQRLDRYRVRHDMSFRELGDAMAAAGFVIHWSTLHRLVRAAARQLRTPNSRQPNRQPFDRTRFKIEEFLRHADALDSRRRNAARRKRQPLSSAAPVRSSSDDAAS